MIKNQYVLSFLVIIQISSQSLNSSNAIEKHSSSFNSLIEKYLLDGEVFNSYLSYTQYLEFLNKLQQLYPSLITLSSIGNTYENNKIPLIIISSSNKETKPKSSILINGMHHARETVSMMMNLYIILHLVSAPNYILEELLSTTTIYFIPIVNVDGYKLISEIYKRTNNIEKCYIRKNRRPHDTIKCRKDEEIGVDLNRNYGVEFGIDNEGSSDRPCSEDYRGTSPFSEPETQAIKKFFEEHPEIKIAINYHTFGNLVITPFNCYTNEKSDKLLKENYPQLFEFYKEFEKEANYPHDFLFGNGHKTIKYKANGDASDWMLHERKALSFSPELGNGERVSDTFFPNKSLTFDILESNLPSAIYAIQKSGYYLKAHLNNSYYHHCESYFFNIQGSLINCDSDENSFIFIVFSIKNEGFSDFLPNQTPDLLDNNDKMVIDFGLIRMKSLCLVTSEGEINTDVDNSVKCESIQTQSNHKRTKDEDPPFEISFDINKPIPSRKQLNFLLKVTVDKEILKVLIDDFRAGNISQKIISIKKSSKTSFPGYSLYPKSNNTKKPVTWNFFDPSFDVYNSNITQSFVAQKFPEMPLTSMLLILFVVVGTCLIIFLIYIGLKWYKKRKTLNEQVTDLPTISIDNTIPSQKDPTYIELPSK